MGKIVAYGGGGKTSKIDREAIRMTGKKSPTVLFLPTASYDHGYYTLYMDRYLTKMGCKFSYLNLLTETYTKKEIQTAFDKADIIYVGGGNTLNMMLNFKKLGVYSLIIQAYNEGKVMMGGSAGSICWFRQGNSDSRLYSANSTQLIKVSGFNFIDALHCPHYDKESFRQPVLKEQMKTTKGVAIAIDNCAAIVVDGDKYKIISQDKESNAYKVFWKDKYYKLKLEKNKWKPIHLLLQKTTFV